MDELGYSKAHQLRGKRRRGDTLTPDAADEPRQYNSTLRQRKPLQRRTALGNARVAKQGRKRLLRPLSIADGQRKRYTCGNIKSAVRLKRIGKRGAKLHVAHRKWRQRLIDIWGERCIWPFDGPCGGHLEAMHAYGKGAHPEWRVEEWNGFMGCVHHHRRARENFTTTPWLTKALQECADMMRAAHEGKRPQPTWAELQDIIVRARRAR